MAPLDASISQKLLKVRRLDTQDVASYRELRLEGLNSHPEAFGASWEDESVKPASWWTERLQANIVFGGWIDRSPLLGVAGLRMHAATKLRHKGILWGMYVRPAARRTGLAAALVQRVIEYAEPLVEGISLTVVASNAVALRVYSAAGFEQYGLERRALKIGDAYFDEVLMTLSLPRRE
jgi:GNAT superfamily N-acetyltransferase